MRRCARSRGGLRRAREREQYEIDTAEAVRYRDIHRAILDYSPNIVHFSGHGAGEEGLMFEDERGHARLVDAEALAGLFELFADQVECVVLNACYSEVQAQALAQHINHVIGMSQAIGDRAAIEFAVGFYDALGAGRPVEFAYSLGCSAIRIAGIPENLTPQLLTKNHAAPRPTVRPEPPPVEPSLSPTVTPSPSPVASNQSQPVDRFSLSVEKQDLVIGLQKSIVLILSRDPGNEEFGTGFVIMKEEMKTYLLTSVNVVRKVGGIDQVLVDNCSATLIARSPERCYDDLAVLQVNGLLEASILPLGKCGQIASPFVIFACQTFGCQLNEKSYKIKQINGCLGGPDREKKRYQRGWTETWTLKIEDGSSLTPEFDGSPVIDITTRTVMGIVKYRENYPQGLAICITTLKKVWLDIPPTLLREENQIYNLVEMGDLLQKVFKEQQEDQFFRFVSENFPSTSINRENRLYLQIEDLINHCYKNHKLDLLSKIIEELNHKHFCLKIIEKIKINHSSDNCCKWLNNLFRPKETNGINETRSLAEITFEIDSSKLTPERLELAFYALARNLKIPWSDIKLLEVKPGAIVKVEIPFTAVDKLIDLYQHDIVSRRNLGIAYVKETFDERFDLKNLQELLEKGFTRKELAAICRENFKNFYKQIRPDSGKGEIIDRLVRQKSIIPELIDLASQWNSEAFNKFRPYYRVPRKPDGKALRQFTKQEIILAVFLGVCVTIFGILALSFIDLIVRYIDQTGLLSSIVGFGLFPLGDFVGSVVLRVLRGRRGLQTGRLAVISYLIGCAALPVGLFSILFFIVSFLILVEAISLFPSDPIGALERIGNLIYYLWIYILGILTIFKSLSTTIGIAGGSYLAYQRAR